jgi:hypothetical protein
MIHSDLDPAKLGHAQSEMLSIAGAAGVFGFIPLLVCMGAFWLKCDVSSRLNRTIWFGVLLAGFAYGSLVAYYAVVYLPAVMRRLRNPKSEEPATETLRIEANSKRMGPFSRALLIVWGFVLAPVAVVLALPRATSGPLFAVAASFFLWSAFVILEAALYAVFSVYRSGINRTARSDGEESTSRRRRD